MQSTNPGYGFNRQNRYGDTVCWCCRGDAFACDCPTERHPLETAEAFRSRILPFLSEVYPSDCEYY